MPPGVSPAQAMRRFHVVRSDGSIVSGAVAFVEVWGKLPGWRWVARTASSPGILAILEWGYRLFLPLRPYLSGLFARLMRWSTFGSRLRRT